MTEKKPYEVPERLRQKFERLNKDMKLYAEISKTGVPLICPQCECPILRCRCEAS